MANFVAKDATSDTVVNLDQVPVLQVSGSQIITFISSGSLVVATYDTPAEATAAMHEMAQAFYVGGS